MGLREIFLSRSLEEERIVPRPVGRRAAEATGTFSTRPSSTTSEIGTTDLDAVSLRVCHHETSAHWCLWQCDGARQPNPNKHSDQLGLDLCMLSLRNFTGHKRDLK